MIKEILGEKIKQLRTKQNLSQKDFAKLLKIERSQISKIESGKVNLTLERILKISKALGVSLDQLFSFKETFNTKPVVKWAGGKTQLLSALKEHLPKDFNNYFEPFVGGGALLFGLNPKQAYINDFNADLMSIYECLQDPKLTAKMLELLKEHEKKHSEEYYYQIRSMDQDSNFNKLSLPIKGARLIYLNKSCFNGLYRVNSKGYFNVPWGKKEKVVTFEEDNIKEIQKYFAIANVRLFNGDYTKCLEKAKENDFVYLDPPYDVIPNKSGFVSYNKEGFGTQEQVRLSQVYKQLHSKGVKVMLSNHNTPLINELYKDFNITIVKAKRMINSKGDKRGAVEEVIITNY